MVNELTFDGQRFLNACHHAGWVVMSMVNGPGRCVHDAATPDWGAYLNALIGWLELFTDAQEGHDHNTSDARGNL
ncbi:MAG TPA: hypothetical protein VNH11_24755 [Pirellulales bacterium]|nr:hypothetical protein [Pirellulales bacterium]